jgi:hypothetical protein
MKKFIFPLARVMDWRGTQARIEEMKLEGLNAELRGIDLQIAAVLDALAVSDQSLLAMSSATGSELAARPSAPGWIASVWIAPSVSPFRCRFWPSSAATCDCSNV